MADAPNPYRLTLRGTYILPTRPGMLQALGWVLLAAASLNFGLGVMLVFSLLLAAIALVCMVETVRNLAGLEVELHPPAPLAAGGQAEFVVVLRPTDGRARPALQVALSGTDMVTGWRARLGLHALRHGVRCDVPSSGLELGLVLDSAQRGQLQPERLVVASTWPLGLFRAWRGWQPPVSAAIHPEALAEPPRPAGADRLAAQSELWTATRRTSGDGDAHGEFHGHRRRRAADPLRRVDWRASLRSGVALVAQRESAMAGQPVWLRYSDHAPADHELRLARLTTEVLAASRAGRRYGLELPGQVLPPDQGPLQRDRALRLIAECPADGAATPPVHAGLTPAPAAMAVATLPAPVLLRWTVTMVLAALPLAVQLPAHAWLPWLLLTAVRLLLLREGSRAPGTLWLTLGAVAGTAWIHSRYHALIGREPGMALLLIMAGLKMLEARRERDLHTLTVLGLFLLLSAHFRDQPPWLAAWDLVCCGLMLHGLVSAQSDQPMVARLRVLARLGAIALPLAVVLFLLVPRPDHPFWGFGAGDEGMSGSLSDHMTPGSVSRLRLSDRVAFRVRFQGDWPPLSRMYWRGPVLDRFDGTTWSTTVISSQGRAQMDPGTQSYEYQYQAEPGSGDWVFALETPEALDRGLRVDAEAVTHLPASVGQSRPWHLRAWTSARLQGRLEVAMRHLDLEVPDSNPRTQALALPWRNLPPDARITAAQHAFVQAHLRYSLDGPPLAPDLIDDLLFGSKVGYCEHFASAFAFMLRVAGVPSRVVTGYQGGERNPLGDYLIVRQADAHAWVEAWLDDRGWIRIDPTALTVPDLLQGGNQVAQPLPMPAWMPGFVRAGIPVWHRLQLLRDLAAMQWQRNIAALDPERQRVWLDALGLGDLPKAQLFAACALLVSAALGVQLLVAMRRPRALTLNGLGLAAGQASAGPAGESPAVRRSRRRWQRCWRMGEALLRMAGTARGHDESPLHYATRVVDERPLLSTSVTAWAAASLAGIYGPGQPAGAPPHAGRTALLAGLLLDLLSAAWIARVKTGTRRLSSS